MKKLWPSSKINTRTEPKGISGKGQWLKFLMFVVMMFKHVKPQDLSIVYKFCDGKIENVFSRKERHLFLLVKYSKYFDIDTKRINFVSDTEWSFFPFECFSQTLFSLYLRSFRQININKEITFVREKINLQVFCAIKAEKSLTWCLKITRNFDICDIETSFASWYLPSEYHKSCKFSWITTATPFGFRFQSVE